MERYIKKAKLNAEGFRMPTAKLHVVLTFWSEMKITYFVMCYGEKYIFLSPDSFLILRIKVTYNSFEVLCFGKSMSMFEERMRSPG